MTSETSTFPSPASGAFRETLKLIPAVLTRSALALVVVHFARSVSDEFATSINGLIQARGREELTTILGVVALQFIFELIWAAIWSFVAIRSVRSVLRPTSASLRSSAELLNQLMIESVRSLAAVLYRLPLLIIPGLVEIIRLLFVPHVVLLEPEYAAGRMDALARSRKLVRHVWPVLTFALLVNIGITAAVTSFLQGETGDWMWQKPGAFAVALALTFVINLFYEVFLVSLYLRVAMIHEFTSPHGVEES